MSDFNSDEFLKGQQDCKEGMEHKQGMSESYNRGYAAQYQHEQNMNEICQEQKTDAMTDDEEYMYEC